MSVCTSTVTSNPPNVDEPSASANVRAGEHAEAEPAVLLGDTRARASRGRRRAEDVARHLAGRLPLVAVGLDLPLEEVPERLAEQLMLVDLDHRRTIPPANFAPQRVHPYTAHP